MKLLNLKYVVAIFCILLSITKTNAQIITTVAGNGTKGYSGDGGAATNANLFYPSGVAVDAVGNLYIADVVNNRIRKVNTSGVISTVAGNGTQGYSGDGGEATSASLFQPSGVAVDAAGNIFIADQRNNRIRKVNTSGVISTVAGNGIQDYTGDGGAATNASFWSPNGVAVDSSGNIFIADRYNNRIRKVDTNGIVSTVAGNSPFGVETGRYSGDGGAATSASLNTPYEVALDAMGNIYIADGFNMRIRKVNTSGVISTVAGNGTQGYSGDGGVATSAALAGVGGVAVDAAGSIYIADYFNERIRKVDTNGIISTVAGNGSSGYSGDEGAATSASFTQPIGVAVDAAGNIYIADYFNNRIRKVSGGAVPIALASFTAIANNKTITTNWHTSTELNTHHFIIQHSTDGGSFTDLGIVKAIGSGANSYSFTDNNPANGINYYRLKSVDKDGGYTYSKVVSVQITVNSNQLSVFPNPSKDKLMIKGSHIASIQVIDNLGRVLKTQTLKDATNQTLSVVGLPIGTYQLRVQTTDGKVISAGFVKE